MTTRAAAFFDLDKTLLSRSSTLAFSRPFYEHGLISRTAMLRGILAQAVFQRAGAGQLRMERIRDQASRLCQGWPAEGVRAIVRDNLETIIVPHLYDEARDLVAGHRAAGRDIIVVSASGHEVVDPIGALLGADTVIATEMVIADGRYTGDVAFYAFGEAKAARIRELALERGYRLADCYAYSDSITDVPMLATVGHPTAVNPDRALRREAARRGWPIRVFTASPYRRPAAEPPVHGM
ncbi:MAG TPA: HAD family hydrolase [Streptosporangiaceae bacterium]|nr:HAD family hydrolase [Streptosporangiaceae bacterium]